MINDLIRALQILAPYIPAEHSPTWCEHDVLHIEAYVDLVSEEDKRALKKLGVHEGNDNSFYSFKFGRA